MSTIYLKGGRGSVTVDIVDMNPNYVVGVSRSGEEVIVPQRIIRSIEKG